MIFSDCSRVNSFLSYYQLVNLKVYKYENISKCYFLFFKVNDGSGRLAIIMELANTNLRDELNKIENYFGIPYRMLILLIAHLGLFIDSFAFML